MVGKRRCRGVGVCGQKQDLAARGFGGADQGGDGAELAGAGGGEEKVALANGRRGHVALHGDTAAEMVQAHGEALERESLAAAAIEDDGVGCRDHLAGGLDAGLVDPVGDGGEVCGGLAEGGLHGASRSRAMSRVCS